MVSKARVGNRSGVEDVAQRISRLDRKTVDAPEPVILRTFDTLGFTCTYVLDRAVSSADRWVLNAESVENVPKGMKARYIYTRPSENEYHEVLELDTDGKGFKSYVTNRFLRVQSPRS